MLTVRLPRILSAFAAVLVVACVWASASDAATVTLVPSNERALPAARFGWDGNGSCGFTNGSSAQQVPFYLNVNEDVDTPIDTCASLIDSYHPGGSAGTNIIYFDMTDPPSGLLSATSMNLRVRAWSYQSSAVSVTVYNSAGTSLKACNILKTPNNVWQTTACSFSPALSLLDTKLMYVLVSAANCACGGEYIDISGINIDVTYTTQATSTAPNVPTLVSPADPTTTSDRTPSLTATFSDPNAAEQGSIDFQICSDAACSTVVQSGSPPLKLANGANGTWDAWGELPSATYYWRARNEDQTGAYSGWSTVRTLTVYNNTAPTAPTLVLPANASASATSTPVLYAYFRDADTADNDTGTLHFEVCTVATAAAQSCTAAGGTVLASGASASGIAIDAYTTWMSTSLPAGTSYWHAYSTDNRGLSGPWSATWSIVISNNAPTAPTLVTPAAGANTASTTPTFTATFQDPDAGNTGRVSFEVCTVATTAGQSCTAAGGTVAASGSSAAGLAIGGSGNWTSSALTPNTYYWHAYGVDNNGGTGAWTATRVLIIDATVSVAISSGATQNLGSLSTGSVTNATAVANVATNGPLGYSLNATDTSDTAAFTCVCGGSVPDWTGTGAAPTVWPVGTSGYAGVSVLSVTGTTTSRSSLWGPAAGGYPATDYTNNKYAGLDNTTSVLLHKTTSVTPSVDTVTFNWRMNAGASTTAGNYSATITVTAIGN